MLNQDTFFDKFKVKDLFEKSGLEWETLEKIYDDYSGRYDDIKNTCREIDQTIADNITIPIHSIRSRVKDPEHLIEKIIRKRGKEQKEKYSQINAENYLDIIRDFIGIRILVLSKEEWEGIFDWMVTAFSGKSDAIGTMEERPVAYTRYGDRDIFGDKIHKEHTNKGYRSQHYIVKYKNYYCEIQVRTLAEEVFGEFDHKVKYPYREDNKFLKRYTTSVSQLLDSVDEIISTCFQLGETGWENCNSYYEDDRYVDWQNISQSAQKGDETLDTDEWKTGTIDIGAYADTVLLRKG